MENAYRPERSWVEKAISPIHLIYSFFIVCNPDLEGEMTLSPSVADPLVHYDRDRTHGRVPVQGLNP